MKPISDSRCSLLEVGSELLMINGESVLGVSLKQANDLLTAAETSDQTRTIHLVAAKKVAKRTL